MSSKIRPSGYSRTQIVLHWLVFALIAQQYIVSDAMSDSWDRVTEGAQVGFDPLVLAHVTGGTLILIFTVWRLTLRARRGAPAPVEGNTLQVIIAKITHVSLYVLLILMPVSGAVAWFGEVEASAQSHNLMRIILLVLVALHIVGALYHHFVLHDGTVARMLKVQE